MKYSNNMAVSSSNPDSTKEGSPRHAGEQGSLLLRREIVHVVRIKTGMRTGALAPWGSQAPGTSHIGTIVPPIDG